MTEAAGPSAETDVLPERRLSPADAAMARYRASMRRSRAVYYAVVGVVVLALGVWVAVTWARGEAAHAFLHTVPAAPPGLGLATPSSQPTQAWHSSDRLALGTPQAGGTVITYSEHSVRGRDARTGRPTWSYTRTDRTVCMAAQLSAQPPGGTTVAVYDHDGNCDEVSAFDSGTGRRLWTRTLDMDGMPVNGRPAYQVTPYTFLAYTSSVIYAIDPGTGYNRWTYQRYGCAIEHVALGSGGALISQNCSAKVRCKSLKFCGRGPQLLLRDGSAGRADNKPNADQIKWNRIGDRSIPVSADELVSSTGPRGRVLYVNDSGSGDRSHRIPLGSGGALRGVTTTNAADIIWLGGVAYAVQPDAAKAQWRVATESLPTAVSRINEGTVSLSSARVTAVVSTGIATISGSTGKITQRFTLPAVPAGSIVYPLGTGFLVGAPSGTTAYR